MLAALRALNINHVSNIQQAALKWLLSDREIMLDTMVKDENGEDMNNYITVPGVLVDVIIRAEIGRIPGSLMNTLENAEKI